MSSRQDLRPVKFTGYYDLSTGWVHRETKYGRFHMFVQTDPRSEDPEVIAIVEGEQNGVVYRVSPTGLVFLDSPEEWLKRTETAIEAMDKPFISS